MHGKGSSHERIGCQIKQYGQIKMHQCPQNSVNWDAADVGRAFFHDGDEDTVSGIKQEQGDYQLAGVGAPELEDSVCGAVHLDVLAEVDHEYQQQKNPRMMLVCFIEIYSGLNSTGLDGMSSRRIAARMKKSIK